ncbi:RDH12-like protein [Mya arenaria]|uniref:RDH12-like protein n=2 Tax=Mya arenaria TaxID=6604 RepID=A0ABY7E466_MYAAR|nr:RDH12-like protein [Mya arenaria]
MGCRDRKKGEAVAIQIRTKTHNPDVYCYELDLASLTSIKEFVDDFNNREPTLHVLINNAAYMGPQSTTMDGYERCFGVNYLGHFYLTYLLKDKLRRGAPSRVINLISDTYSKARLNFDDLPLTPYDIKQAYARSKLCMVMFTSELHRRLAGDIIHVYGVHPGWVCTDILRNWPGVAGNILRTVSRVLFKSPEDGSQTVLFCAVGEKMREMSGKVLENCNIFKVKNYAKDREQCERLWNLSLNLCGLESDIPADKRDPGEKGPPAAVQDVGPREAEPKKEK